MRLAVPAIVLGVLACPALPSRAATLTVDMTRMGLPLEERDHGKYFVLPPGVQRPYVVWGVAGTAVDVPDGTYDLLVKYTNDRLEDVKLFERVALHGRVKRKVDFAVPIARFTLQITAAGFPVERFAASYRLYRSGRRDSPIASKRPGETLTILPGTYDIEVAWRGPEGFTTRWLERRVIRDELTETIEMLTEPVVAEHAAYE